LGAAAVGLAVPASVGTVEAVDIHREPAGVIAGDATGLSCDFAACEGLASQRPEHRDGVGANTVRSGASAPRTFIVHKQGRTP